MKTVASLIFSSLILLSFLLSSSALSQSDETIMEFEGKVVDAENNSPLVFADLNISNSNISTVTNGDGEFLLKIPKSLKDEYLTISYLGYEDKIIRIDQITNHLEYELNPIYTELDEVSLNSLDKSARELVVEALARKSLIYNKANTIMTAFYRETIKKRRKNASLSEAVVKIHKRSYASSKSDQIELIKARKNTDYDKLDTLALRLQGGPFSNLYVDIIKYPEYIFSDDELPFYQFSYDSPTRINDNIIYVIDFKQKDEVNYPLYYGKLYIDANTLALKSAVYRLNIENKELSSQMYIRKKPRKVEVYPTETLYRVKYNIKDGRWQFNYSNIALTFKVNWKGKLFNSIYSLNSEIAVTDWEIKDTQIADINKQLLRPSTILTEKASGFSDPRFWGEFNIIEPEKSIESAIKKIQRQLRRT